MIIENKNKTVLISLITIGIISMLVSNCNARSYSDRLLRYQTGVGSNDDIRYWARAKLVDPNDDIRYWGRRNFRRNNWKAWGRSHYRRDPSQSLGDGLEEESSNEDQITEMIKEIDVLQKQLKNLKTEEERRGRLEKILG